MSYLDHAATTPMLAEVLDAYTAAARDVGNASSLHAPGRSARRKVEESREQVAAALGARPSEVIFTSGGTESDNLAVKGIFWGRRAASPGRTRVVASAVEHHAVLDTVGWLESHEGARATWLPVDALGRVSVAAFEAALGGDGSDGALAGGGSDGALADGGSGAALAGGGSGAALSGGRSGAAFGGGDVGAALAGGVGDAAFGGVGAASGGRARAGRPGGSGAVRAGGSGTARAGGFGAAPARGFGAAAGGGDVALATVMWANNEVGTVQQIAALAAVAAAAGVPLHTDAIQAVGQVPVDFAASGVAAMSVSGHKLGGPIGVGALLLGRDVPCVPLSHGGGQERDVRSGTLDVPGIVAFAAAVEIAVKGQREHAAFLASLRDALVARVRAAVPEAILNGDVERRLPGNAHFSFPGCEGDALLLLLDAQGIACSTGSACSAGVAQPSHVLIAMGNDDQRARSSLRFTLGHSSSMADVDALVAALPAAVERARRAGATKR